MDAVSPGTERSESGSTGEGRCLSPHGCRLTTPRVLFVGSKNKETANQIASMTSDELVYVVNSRVAEQAVKYVYGVDDRQLRFVANRLGKKLPATPVG